MANHMFSLSGPTEVAYANVYCSHFIFVTGFTAVFAFTNLP